LTGLFLVLAASRSIFQELISGVWWLDLPFFWSLSLPAFYGLSLWLLRRNPPHKFGLALIVGSATLWSIICLACFVVWVVRPAGSRTEWIVGLSALGALTVLQVTYGTIAARAHFRLRKARADWRRLAAGFGVVALVMVALILGAVKSVVDEGRHWMAVSAFRSAFRSLRTINEAEETYAGTYRGYSPDLGALGPPPPGTQPTATAAGLIDEVLANGVKQGYRFIYKPAHPNAKGHITSYTICARPIEWGTTGQYSYFTDEAGIIRQTAENRCATARDPLIGK